MSTFIWWRLLNDLDVLSIRSLLTWLASLNLHRKGVSVLHRARHRVFQSGLSRLALRMLFRLLVVLILVEALYFKIRLAIHSIHVGSGMLLRQFFVVHLIDKGVFEEFVLIWLWVRAFKCFKSSHKFDVTALWVCVFNMHLILSGAIVSIVTVRWLILRLVLVICLISAHCK